MSKSPPYVSSDTISTLIFSHVMHDTIFYVTHLSSTHLSTPTYINTLSDMRFITRYVGDKSDLVSGDVQGKIVWKMADQDAYVGGENVWATCPPAICPRPASSAR